MKEKKILILLFITSLTIKLPLILFTTSFGVYESLYLSTAIKFAETGIFGLNTEFNDERFIAPLLPFLQSIFYSINGIYGILIISVIFSSLTIIVFYYLGKLIIGEKYGLITALIAFFNPALLIIASRPLTESVGIFFFSFAFLAIYLTFKNKSYKLFPLITPILFILTFLTRFQYGALILILFISYIIISKNYKIFLNKNFLLGILISLLIFSPWALQNIENYGNFIGGASKQASFDLGFNPSQAILYFPYFFIIIGSIFPFTFYGIYKKFNKKNILIIAGIIIIFITQFIIFGKTAEERYLLPILPIATILTIMGYSNLCNKYKKHKKLINYFFVILLLINISIGFYGVNLFQELPKYNETKNGSIFLKENCNSPIISNSYRQIRYYTNFEILPLFDEINKSLKFARERGVNCIMINVHEPPFINILEKSDKVIEIYNVGKIKIYSFNN